MQGNIIKQDSKSLQISVDGVTMTYYADEIKDIDGNPFVVQSQASAPEVAPGAPALPADATQPAPAAETVAQPEAAVNPAVAPDAGIRGR